MSGIPTFPEEARELETVYSNLDHQFDSNVLEELRNNPETTMAQHAAWEFCGYVWHTSCGQWACKVMRHRSVVDIVVADTPEELTQAVCEQWGSE